jgi:hypothetical protein
MKTVIQILLSIIIIFLGYSVFESIMKPIRFNNEKDLRERIAIAKLIEIREAQKAFKDINLRYTSDFDSLINFVKRDSFKVIKSIGMIPEALIDSMKDLNKAKAIAMKRGIISREESKVAVIDSIFGKNFNVDSLRYVPFTDGLSFNMKAGSYTTTSGLNVKVLEVYVLFENLLKGLDPQLVVNYIDEKTKITRFAGLKFGSFEEGTLSGNWE